MAYEWHDEKFEEYRQAWIALNDEYTHNGSTVLRFDDVSGDREILEQIAEKSRRVRLNALRSLRPFRRAYGFTRRYGKRRRPVQ